MIDDDGPRLPYVCAECGAELMLTPSGHRFCADPTCTEGFGADTAISQQNDAAKREDAMAAYLRFHRCGDSR